MSKLTPTADGFIFDLSDDTDLVTVEEATAEFLGGVPPWIDMDGLRSAVPAFAGLSDQELAAAIRAGQQHLARPENPYRVAAADVPAAESKRVDGRFYALSAVEELDGDHDWFLRPWLSDAEVRELHDNDLRISMELRVLTTIVCWAVDYDEGMSATQLRKWVSGRSPEIDAARDALLRQGRIEKRAGRNGGFTVWPRGFILSTDPGRPDGGLPLRRA